jgi:hypothetical protein
MTPLKKTRKYFKKRQNEKWMHMEMATQKQKPRKRLRCV